MDRLGSLVDPGLDAVGHFRHGGFIVLYRSTAVLMVVVVGGHSSGGLKPK